MIASGPNWNRFFHADGIISLHSLNLENTRVNESMGLFYWTESIFPIELYWYLGLLVSISFTIGFYTRINTILLWVLIRSMLARNPYLANGEEMVLQMCLIYLVWTDLGAAYSVDNWMRVKRGIAIPATLSSWPIRMMQVNVALVYLISLPYKMAQDPGWVTGDALHWTIASDMWGPYQHPWLTLVWDGWLRKLLTFGTVFIEAFFLLAVWFGRTRLFAIAGISMLHLGIAILIPNVTYFTLSMVCCFAAFLTEDDLRDVASFRTHLSRWFSDLWKSLACWRFSHHPQ